jgi:type I restriction-modification system DNA methylase subunit
MKPSAHKKNLIKLIEEVASGRHSHWQVFSDFVSMSAIAISNQVDLSPHRVAREATYMETVKRYSKSEVDKFPQMFKELFIGLEEGPHDLLGDVFMELELGNDRGGQFFTPWHISTLMASITMGDEPMRAAIAEKGYVTVSEPACGAGTMLIAAAEAMRHAGLDYRTQMHVTAIDVDLKAVQMTYIQLSLLHVPAVVVHGNTISLEEYSQWYTPAHIVDGWTYRLRGETPPQLELPPEEDDQSGLRAA